jgi:hypothetical protein
MKNLKGLHDFLGKHQHKLVMCGTHSNKGYIFTVKIGRCECGHWTYKHDVDNELGLFDHQMNEGFINDLIKAMPVKLQVDFVDYLRNIGYSKPFHRDVSSNWQFKDVSSNQEYL